MLPSQTKADSALFPRRLPAVSRHTRKVEKSNCSSTEPVQEVRSTDQSQEIVHHSKPKSGILRCSIPPGLASTSSAGVQGPEDSYSVQSNDPETERIKKRTRRTPGLAQLRLVSCATRETTSQAVINVDESSDNSDQEGRSRKFGEVIQERPFNLDEFSLAEISSSDESTDSDNTTDDGCISSRLGRGFTPRQDLRSLAPGGQRKFHQLVGTTSHFSHPGTLQVETEGSSSAVNDRQHHSSGLSEEPRDPEVNDFVGFVQENTGVLPEGRDNASAETSSRLSQRTSGQAGRNRATWATMSQLYKVKMGSMASRALKQKKSRPF